MFRGVKELRYEICPAHLGLVGGYRVLWDPRSDAQLSRAEHPFGNFNANPSGDTYRYVGADRFAESNLLGDAQPHLATDCGAIALRGAYQFP